MTTIRHKFVSGKAAAADPTLVDGPEWDAPHVLDGGSVDQVLTRDPAFDPPNGEGWKWAYAKLRETGGPTTLTPGAIPDGALLARQGSEVVGLPAVDTPHIGDGQVTVPKLAIQDFFGENPGSITVTAGATALVDVDLGTVNAGDRLLIWARALMTKGATGGLTLISVTQSGGTATVQWDIGTSPNKDISYDHPANALMRVPFSGHLKVTAGGTLTLRLQATSSGSNASVGGGAADLFALRLAA